ncbi:MAG: hypothetical protein N3B21_10080 [Clostridia bacterium]|nr:hypothetical protein [Clostridia bacterium]
MIETFTMQTFAEGDAFKVYYGDEQFVEMVLYKALEGKNKLPSMFRKPFSLIFKAAREVFFNQGVYKIEHEKVGCFEICITPTVSPDGGQEAFYYEACFN